MKRFYSRIGSFGILLIILFLVACAGQQERLWLKAPGWSRAQMLGNTRVGDPIPIALGDSSEVYLFMIGAGEERPFLRLLAMDQDADVLWDRSYEGIELMRPEKPGILWDGDVLHLFWIAARRLYHTQVDSEGEMVSPPAVVSGDTVVGDYDVASMRDAGIAVWFAGPREEPGLYTLPPDDLQGEPTLVDPEGVHPKISYDNSMTLHVGWARIPPGAGSKPFIYASYPNGVYRPDREMQVVAPRISGTTVLEGPELGVDQGGVYFFWSLIFFSGLEAGTAVTRYIHFPKDDPLSVSPDRLLVIPDAYNLSYQSVPGGELIAGDRVPLGEDFRAGNRYITRVETNPTGEEELVITFSTRIAYLMRKTQSQVGAVFLKDGVPASYQLLSFTPSFSTEPAIFSDKTGRLFFTWLEKGELPGWIVYLAATTPGFRSALGGVELDDIGRLGAEVLFGMLSSALLVPFILVWAAAPLILLVLTSRLRKKEENLTDLRTVLSLLFALAGLWVVKLAVLPGMRQYVPFSAWLPFIPSEWSAWLRFGVPFLIGVIGLLSAWLYSARKDINSVYVFILMYIVVDGFLTMAVYGVLVFAAF